MFQRHHLTPGEFFALPYKERIFLIESMKFTLEQEKKQQEAEQQAARSAKSRRR